MPSRVNAHCPVGSRAGCEFIRSAHSHSKLRSQPEPMRLMLAIVTSRTMSAAAVLWPRMSNSLGASAALTTGICSALCSGWEGQR
jgi:hypothetical protein